MTFVLGLFAGWVIGFVMCAMLSARTRHEDEQAARAGPGWRRE